MKLRPVDERLLIKPVEEEEERKVGSIIIPDTATKDRPQIGEVIAIGDDVEKSTEARKKTVRNSQDRRQSRLCQVWRYRDKNRG